MAEFCQECFVEKIMSSTEQMLYEMRKLSLQLSEDSELCEGCGKILPVVIAIIPKRRMLY